MAEESQVKRFSLDLQWPANPGKGGIAQIDESMGLLTLAVDDQPITAYQTDSATKSSAVCVPLYYLVEWLALNWWAFLYEPRKEGSEDAERDFRSRHWLGTPRNGFALPDVMFTPDGGRMEVSSRATYLRFAQLNFTKELTALTSTEDVRASFDFLVTNVLARLTEHGVKNTTAHEVWDRIKETTKEEEVYCRLVGSMGLSPYRAHPDIDEAIDNISSKISDTMLSDLCDATNIANFNRAANLTEGISSALQKASAIQLSGLTKSERPHDATSRAYEWGYSATDVARNALKISHDDPLGAQAFFEKLKFDLKHGIEDSGLSIVSGAIERTDEDARISLAGTSMDQRKFAAARAAFLGWSGGKSASRLVTSAKTRDQQASRAFAAELLAPAKFLRKRLGNRAEVSPFTLDAISREIGAAPTVVRYQAQNNGYQIADAA